MADPSLAEQEALKKKRTFKKFSYRGVDLDQLLDMNDEKLVELFHCRARRRYRRGMKRKHIALLKRLRKAKKEAPPMEKPEVVKTHLRNMIIKPEMVGSVVGVYQGKTFNQILADVFDEDIASVAHHLLHSGVSPLPLICRGMPREQVKQALVVLIRHGLVTFTSNPSRGTPEYGFDAHKTLTFLRFSRFLTIIQHIFGTEGQLLVHEIMLLGECSASQLLFRVAKKARTNQAPSAPSIFVLRDVLERLMLGEFIRRTPSVPGELEEDAAVPTFMVPDETEQFIIPTNMVLKELQSRLEEGADQCGVQPDAGILLQLNQDRFHQESRDKMLMEVVSRRMGRDCALAYSLCLNLAREKGDPWAPISAPLSIVEIRNAIHKSDLSDALKNVDVTLRRIEEDQFQFLRRYGDAGGGQYVVSLKACFEFLAQSYVQSVIRERFGSKTARIFRLVLQKKYVDPETIQKSAMMPAKEGKLLAYTLFEAGFLQLREVRRTTSGSAAAPGAKSFYLFYVDFPLVCRFLLESAYKAARNLRIRRHDLASDSKRLLDKERKVSSVIRALKQQGGTEEQIQEVEELVTEPEKEVLKKLHRSSDLYHQGEQEVDEGVFLLQTYLYYRTLSP